MAGGRVAGVLVLVTILATACGGTSPAATRGRIAPQTIPRIAWKDCGDGFQCARMPVPLDYSNPRSSTISLALIRRPATDIKHRIGALLLNPGGPGGSGVDFLRGAASSLAELNSNFDLVSWDPRGVGASAPIICTDDSHMARYFALDPVLDDAQEKQDAVQALQDFAASCEERNGPELPYVDAASTAHDMDRIREALGERQLTYLGFSYGTYLGQWYAHLFPKRVRALALDGVFDPTASRDSLQLLQAVGFQQNLDAFFTACRSDATCVYTRKGNPQERLIATMSALDRAPMRIGDRVLTRSMAMNAVIAALYYTSAWSYLDEALSALDNGDGRLLLQLADSVYGRNRDGTYSNLSKGAGEAISCLDFGASSDIAAYDARGPLMSRASELFGPFLQYADLACLFWPAKGRHAHEPLTIAGSPRILLVGATGDPATPYVQAQSVAKQIPGSFLLTRNGYGHTSYFASSCIKSDVDNYLISLTWPLPGKVCPG